MKGFKAFGKGLVCRGKQYKENTVFEEEKAVICTSGMHFCENPLDVLDYYPLADDNGNIVEVAEVEALAECKTDDNKKYCTKKLKIGLKLSLSELVKEAIDFVHEKNGGKMSTGNYAQLASSGDLRVQAITHSLRVQAMAQNLRVQAMAQNLRVQAITHSLRVQAMAQLLPELEDVIQQRGRKVVG